MTTEQRIIQLEKQLRQQRLGIVAMAIAICSAVSISATYENEAVFDTVKAKRIIIQNNRGFTSVDLRSDTEGDGRVTTYRSTGRELIELSSTVSGEGILSTYSSTGRKLVELNGTESRDGTITTYSASGLKLVDIGATADGGSLYLFNKTGDGIVTIQSDDYGNGQVGAWNRQGKGLIYDSK